MQKKTWLIGLSILALVVVLIIFSPVNSKVRSSLGKQLKLTAKAPSQNSISETGKAHAQEPSEETKTPVDKAPSSEVKESEATKEPPAPTPQNPAVASIPMPSEVKGVYATGWIAGSSKFFPRLVQFMDETEVNSLVVDIKDDTGTLSYHSKVPLAIQINAGVRKIPDMVEVLQTLKEHNIYPIARIVAFKDPHLAEARPDLAIKSKSGGLWKDYKGLKWVDPHSKAVWDYTLDVAEEAVALGFKEIQFDYVRFASDGKISECVFPFENGKSKEDVIKDFLAYAKERLTPYGIIISADVFGLTCSAEDDLGIGQKLEKIGSVVDVLSPMVYPSHYYRGTYGISNPDLAPYETINRSMKDAQKKLEGVKVGMRPWLQDFNLGSKYGREQLLAQIKALNDAGVKDWIFWNPSCRYDATKYRSK